MLIYEMFIIGVGQAGSGPKEDVIEILSLWEEEGKRGMQGTCVEQVEQVARLKRLPLTERGRSHPSLPTHRSQCPQDPIPWVGMQIQTKSPGRSRLQPQSQPCSQRASCLCGHARVFSSQGVLGRCCTMVVSTGKSSSGGGPQSLLWESAGS